MLYGRPPLLVAVPGLWLLVELGVLRLPAGVGICKKKINIWRVQAANSKEKQSHFHGEGPCYYEEGTLLLADPLLSRKIQL
jgi:hypothetical protein